MKIVVDAMGGDYAPQAVVQGVIAAVKEFGVNVALVGLESDIKAELSKYKYPQELIEVVHAPEVVEMHESPITVLRKKKDSSIAVGVNLLKTNGYDAFISAGNTGACVASATIQLGLLEGVERPAIGLVIPQMNGFAFMIDVGANTEAKPEHLLQSALMARVYTRFILGIPKPTVGLVNIGEEASKGSGFEKETHKLFKANFEDFAGNIEANAVMKGLANCYICDGYVGNIMIKVAQGLMESMAVLIKREVTKSPIAIVGAFLMRNKLRHIKKMMDYTEYGGAPLLGVNGIVMISHGRSNAKAIKSAIRATMREVEHNILAVMKENIAQEIKVQNE